MDELVVLPNSFVKEGCLGAARVGRPDGFNLPEAPGIVGRGLFLTGLGMDEALNGNCEGGPELPLEVLDLVIRRGSMAGRSIELLAATGEFEAEPYGER